MASIAQKQKFFRGFAVYKVAKFLEILGERGRQEQYQVVTMTVKDSELSDAARCLRGHLGPRNIDLFLKTLEYTFERLSDYVYNFAMVSLKNKIDGD